MKPDRKLQISNGHYLQFDQLARILHAINSCPADQKITMSYLEEDTGLPFRQVRNRISIARAMGIFKMNSLQLTPFGSLISTYDPFFEMKGTLEYIHYMAAGNYHNLIWFEVFNTLLPQEPPMDYQGWIQYFQKSLKDEYTEYSLKDHLPKELRFLIDAYINKGFNKLELLNQTSNGKLYLRRYANIDLSIFVAILLDYAFKQRTNLLQVEDLLENAGAPGLLFALDGNTLKSILEISHEKEYIRYESTHSLNQIRIKNDVEPLKFFEAYYKSEDFHQNNLKNLNIENKSKQ
jgi:hypothetical protein